MKALIKRGPNIVPCGTPEVIFSQILKMAQSWFFAFDFEGNLVSFLNRK